MKIDVAELLKPVIAEARQTGKWLFCAYQGLWFSPDELERENANGRFLWGPVNWQLRDPDEALRELDKKIDRATADRDALLHRRAKEAV